MSKSFVIDQVSWHLNAPGNPELREHITARFWSVIQFLQNNGLTNRRLVSSPNAIVDSFALKSDDLTDQGLELMKKVYDKWLTKVDDGLDPNDVSLFDKELTKLSR